MATRRRNAAGGGPERAETNGRSPSATAAAQPAAAAAAAAAPAPGVPRWFTLYYTVLCGSILTGVAVWFIFFRVPYASHASYDPLQPLPALVRTEVSTFYQQHNASTAATPLTDGSSIGAGAPALRALLDFLVRFQHSGYFDTPMVESYAEHYTESMTEGWIAGVLESLQLDQRAMQEVEQERKGVGSIPGGSRKLNERVARLVSPIVQLMDGGDTIVASDDATDAAPSLWSQLEPDHRMWVYTGLSHCDSTACRWAKMQLVTLWRERLALFPQHANKEQWELVTQMFNPEAQDGKLIDAPPSATTLASLWLRYFGSGSSVYLDRLVDATVLTGASAYQHEKDAEVRAWHERKVARAEAKHREEFEEATKAAAARGSPAPSFRPLPPPKPLPRSPTHELHAHYFNSLLYYAADHPGVKRAVQQALQHRPQEKVLQRLANTTQLRNELKPKV